MRMWRGGGAEETKQTNEQWEWCADTVGLINESGEQEEGGREVGRRMFCACRYGGSESTA